MDPVGRVVVAWTRTNEVGLDHYQVRKHTAWYWHVTLSMVAHAHPAFLAADPPSGPGDRHDHRHSEDHDELATQGTIAARTITLRQEIGRAGTNPTS